MPTLYLRSTDGSDASDGLSWANAKATLAGAFAAAAAGDRIWVSQAHAETQASAMTLTSPGTAAAPVEVLCGSDAAEPPTAMAATATVDTTGASSMSFAGFAVVDGVTFNCGTGAAAAGILFNSTNPWWWKIVNGSLRLNVTSGGVGASITVGSGARDDNLLELYNTTVSFGHAAQEFLSLTPMTWLATLSAILGTPPTVLFSPVNSGASRVLMQGVDLSAMGSGTSLVNVAISDQSIFDFVDCKLGASVGITTGAINGQGGTRVRMVNCDSADTNYRYYYQTFQGTITEETTIVRTGGASDGTTPVSRKMVTTANSKFYSPLVDGEWMEGWIETLASTTVMIPIVTDNVTLTDAEAWLEVRYAGTSGFPLGVFVSDRAASIIATPVNQASDTSAWTTTGLTTPVKQALSVTFTPAEKGLFFARVCLARPNTTLFYDPLNPLSMS